MSSNWKEHFKFLAEKKLDAAGTLQLAVSLFEQENLFAHEKTAIDLGCGTGIDTFFLLANGWHVTAIDKESAAIETIQSGLVSNNTETMNINTVISSFEEMTLHPAMLINATFALPFCHPAYFNAVWERIRESLQPNGRFAGQLLGYRDSWSNRPNMTFHSRAEIDRLFVGFRFNHFNEVNEEGKTLGGKTKRWHIYHVVAQKI